MNLIPMAAAALLMFQTAGAAPKPAAPKAAAPKAAATAPAATDVRATVTYTGKGPVDAGHNIIVFAFAEPNVTAASRPLDTQYASKNGGTVTFKNVTSPIYLFAAYDEKGNYDGRSGPPPAGTPVATYRKAAKGAPAALTGGAAAVKFSFDGSERWK